MQDGSQRAVRQQGENEQRGEGRIAEAEEAEKEGGLWEEEGLFFLSFFVFFLFFVLAFFDELMANQGCRWNHLRNGGESSKIPFVMRLWLSALTLSASIRQGNVLCSATLNAK